MSPQPNAEPEPPAAGGPTAADVSAAFPVEPGALPEAVKVRLAELAASALDGMATVDIPRSLRPVARFAPAKRARLGGAALLEALTRPAFRAAVVRWCRDARPDTLDLVELDAAATDPTAAAVAAVLTESRDAARYLALVSRRATDGALRAERDAARTQAGKLAEELAHLRVELSGSQGTAAKESEQMAAELDRLRKRLRDQGVKLRQARDEAASAAAAAQEARSEAELELKALATERDRERERAEAARARALRAVADAEVARQSARDARAADEVRLSLLLDTLDGATSGLRNELALGRITGHRPADDVRGAGQARGRARKVADPAALDRLLALPAVHLIVDGYNVTKTGYPHLALAEQRSRLIHQLAALAARTSAEVTLVFDGAGVVAVPPAAPRGVRVLFSDPGVIADDVIRSLVAAEPRGRALVVATSDREVVDSVCRRGAHAVPSAVLLARLGRI
ncbi:MAG: NYN domain-containing protein [Sciscionella sp.]